MAHWKHELTRLWHGPPGVQGVLRHPLSGPAVRENPQNGHAFPQDHGRIAHTPLTRAPSPHAPPLATLPPCHTHATSSNSTSPARSAWMTACGSAPNSRELFQHRGAFLHLLCSCNASHQLQKECKDKLSTATPGPQNQGLFRYAGAAKRFARAPHQGAPKRQESAGDRR